MQVLDVIRAVQEIDTSRLAAPFVAADPPRVEGFRRLLQLRESDPAAMERLVEILTVFEPYLGERLCRVANELPGSRYASVREWLAARGYRRVHCAALGGPVAV